MINSHPLSELFIDWVAASRQRLADETELRRKDAFDDEEIEADMGTPVCLPGDATLCLDKLSSVDVYMHMGTHRSAIFPYNYSPFSPTNARFHNCNTHCQWMRFGTEDEGTYYWFNFQNRKLYTDPQYKHILHLELAQSPLSRSC